MSAKPPQAEWLTTRERGTLLGIRWFVFLATVFGRTPARWFLRVVIFYYAIFARRARAASRGILGRVAPRLTDAQREALCLTNGVGFRAVYRHLLRFGEVALDRVFLLKGKTKYFEVTRTGHEHFDTLLEGPRGAILLGAHLGSFEALRLAGRQEALPINILAYFRNAKMVNALLPRRNPAASPRVLSIHPAHTPPVRGAGGR